MRDTSDFVLEISGQAGRYRVDVSSRAGEGSVPVDLDAQAISSRLEELQAVVLASSATPRAVALGLERPVRDVGAHLFETIFPGQIRGLYLSSRQRAVENDEMHRLVLRIRAPELAVLPWELLNNAELGGYLCMREPVVRYVDMPEPVVALPVDPPLHVLGVISLPGNRAALDADSERAGLEIALRPLIRKGLVRLDWVDGQTAEDLSRRLLEGCHVLHFIGHGAYDPARQEGMIALADGNGHEHLLHATALSDLISLARPKPQLIVLNSCQSGMGNSDDLFSSTAAVLVRNVPAVVAMQFAITDKAALRFAASFYEALTFGRPVDEAVRVGRVALVVGKDDSLEWATPVLYLRGGNTHLFDISASVTEDVLSASEATGATGTGSKENASTGTARFVSGALPPKPDFSPHATGRPTAPARVIRTGQWVHSVAFHPDGRRLVTGSRKWVRVWDAQTGNRIWEQAIGWVSTVFATAFSADGYRLATGGADNSARVWASSDGEQLLCVRHDHVVFGVDFSPDGRYLATASADRTVRLWDVTGGEPLLSIPHDQVVRDVAFSPDGWCLASASSDRSARVWSTNGALLTRMRHPHAVRAVAFAPDGNTLATAGEDGTARLWNTRTGHQLLLIRHGGAVKNITFSPDGKWVATASADRTAGIWSVADGSRVLRVQHDHVVFGIAFSPDGQWLASCGEDKLVKLTPVPLTALPHGNGGAGTAME